MNNKILRFALTLFLATVCTFTISNEVKAAGKSNVTILIDPGHGGPATVATNLGACYGGLMEKDMTLLTAAALKAELEKYGNVTVYLSRSADVELSLKDRINVAKSVGADAVVSVHFNASGNHLLYGSEIFVPCGSLYSKGASMAGSIMNQWTSAGMVSKGIKTRTGNNGDYYGVIRHGASAGIPTIILEHGYMDNYHDSTKLDDVADWQKLAALDAAGIAKYYGLKKGGKVSSVTAKNTVKSSGGVVYDDKTPPALVMQIDSYNAATGEVNYTLTGVEPESRLYLYGVSTGVTIGADGSPMPLLTDLSLWGKGNTLKGKITVPAGYVGPLYAIVYNNYDLASNVATANIGF